MRDIKYILEYYKRSYEVWRCNPHPKLIASCTTMESANAAKRLLHGEEIKKEEPTMAKRFKMNVMKDYFSLHTEPEDLLSAYAYERPGKRVKMKLISGRDLTTVVDMNEERVITHKDIENGIVLRRVRIHGMTEHHGILWKLAGPGEDGITLEGWISPSAFSY